MHNATDEDFVVLSNEMQKTLDYALRIYDISRVANLEKELYDIYNNIKKPESEEDKEVRIWMESLIYELEMESVEEAGTYTIEKIQLLKQGII